MKAVVAYVFTTRDIRVGQALIDDLCNRFSLEEAAGVLLIRLEQLIWFDADAFVWAIGHLIPTEIVQEIKQLFSVTLSRRLIEKGMVPDQDFSADFLGKLLLNAKARAVIW